MATRSLENLTLPDGDPEQTPIDGAEDQTSKTVEDRMGSMPPNEHSPNGSARTELVNSNAVEQTPTSLNELDSALADLELTKSNFGELYGELRKVRAKIKKIIKKEHPAVVEAYECVKKSRKQLERAKNRANTAFQDALDDHEDYKSLQEYLSLVRVDAVANRAHIKSLLREAEGVQGNGGETPNSSTDGSRSSGQIANELGKAQQTEGWYVAEEQAAKQAIDNAHKSLRSEICEQPEVASLIQAREDRSRQVETDENTQRIAHTTATEEVTRNNPQLAEQKTKLEAKMSLAEHEIVQAQARIDLIAGITRDETLRWYEWEPPESSQDPVSIDNLAA